MPEEEYFNIPALSPLLCPPETCMTNEMALTHWVLWSCNSLPFTLVSSYLFFPSLVIFFAETLHIPAFVWDQVSLLVDGRTQLSFCSLPVWAWPHIPWAEPAFTSDIWCLPVYPHHGKMTITVINTRRVWTQPLQQGHSANRSFGLIRLIRYGIQHADIFTKFYTNDMGTVSEEPLCSKSKQIPRATVSFKL